MSQAIQDFKKAIEDSQRIVFFGGAGVSTESGIPDFRSANGIFMQETHSHYRPEEVISAGFFEQYPQVYFDFHFDKLVYPKAQPNPGHRFMAQLEQTGKDVTIVTQNIDGLHQKAGSSRVYELHGTVLDNYCLTCGKHYRLDDLEKDAQGIPRCPIDGGIVRPNIVMYGEGLDPETLTGAIRAIAQADLLIVAGTSLVVYPAAGLIDYFRGDHLVVINKTPLRGIRQDAIVFEDSLSHIFKQVMA